MVPYLPPSLGRLTVCCPDCLLVSRHIAPAGDLAQISKVWHVWQLCAMHKSGIGAAERGLLGRVRLRGASTWGREVWGRHRGGADVAAYTGLIGGYRVGGGDGGGP